LRTLVVECQRQDNHSRAADAAPQGRDNEGASDEDSCMVRLERLATQGSEAQLPTVRLQPLEWVHLWPRHVAGRARSDLRVAHWRQYGGAPTDAGVICFAHDMGIRPNVFHCRDHHLLFLNDPAANVSQTLVHPLVVPSTITVKALVDCCGAGWQGHSCDHHGASQPAALSSF
jgi:hypothetical protein